jgi:two-component system, cell cycle sensor histidine kinase and response regulator CckA
MTRPQFCSSTRPSELNPNRGINIVLVDDESSVLFALQLLLKAVGYNVLEFQSSTEAVKYFDTWEPDDSSFTTASKDQSNDERTSHIVLSDLRMPEMDGFDLIRQVRIRRPALPIILMSAHASPREQDLAKQLGCDAFLAKPFTPDQLHEAIDRLMAGYGEKLRGLEEIESRVANS